MHDSDIPYSIDVVVEVGPSTIRWTTSTPGADQRGRRRHPRGRRLDPRPGAGAGRARSRPDARRPALLAVLLRRPGPDHPHGAGRRDPRHLVVRRRADRRRPTSPSTAPSRVRGPSSPWFGLVLGNEIGAGPMIQPDFVPHLDSLGNQIGVDRRSEPDLVPRRRCPQAVRRPRDRRRQRAHGTAWSPGTPAARPCSALVVARSRAGGEDGPTPDETRGLDWRAAESWPPRPGRRRPQHRAADHRGRRATPGGRDGDRLGGPAPGRGGLLRGQAPRRTRLCPMRAGSGRRGWRYAARDCRFRGRCMRYGVPCAPPAVALVHELRLERDFRELVVMIEMALLARLVHAGRSPRGARVDPADAHAALRRPRPGDGRVSGRRQRSG